MANSQQASVGAMNSTDKTVHLKLINDQDTNGQAELDAFAFAIAAAALGDGRPVLLSYTSYDAPKAGSTQGTFHGAVLSLNQKP